MEKSRHCLFIMFACLVLSGLVSFSGTALADSAPSQFVRKLGDTALMKLTGKNVTRATRETRVRDILRANFDIQTIGRFALGTHWKSATETQRRKYMDLYEDMIVQTYTTRFEDYSGQQLKVDGSTTSGKDFIVKSQVVQQDGPPVNLEWRISNKTGSPKVIDVVVEGVSMSVTQRSDFNAVIQRNDGSIDGLLNSLRERREAAKNRKD